MRGLWPIIFSLFCHINCNLMCFPYVRHSNQPLKHTKTTQGHKQMRPGIVNRTLVIKVNTANLDRFSDEITHHRPSAKNTSDWNRHFPWFWHGKKAQGAFSSFSAIMWCNEGKGWSERSESRGDLWITGVVCYSPEPWGQCQRVIPPPREKTSPPLCPAVLSDNRKGNGLPKAFPIPSD